MTAVSKPLYWSVGVPFNELFWASSTGALTENAANLLYLQKTVVDTASALETFSGGLLTDSVGALAITSNLDIATSQTSGILNIGTLATREAAGVINIGASGGLHTIVMDTSSLANTNAAPAISIGTSASAKTVKINNNSNSVHCSSIDLKGASINHIVANSATPITIGDGQTNSVGGLLIGCSAAGNVRTSAPIKIGADTTTTGVITIGASGSSTSMLGTTTISALKTTSIDSTGAIAIGAAATGVTLGQASGATSILGTASTLTYTGGSTITCPTLSATTLDGATLSIGTSTATTMTLARSACPVACNGLLTAANGLTIGTGKNITLSSGTVAPVSGQVGFIQQGTLSTSTNAINDGQTIDLASVAVTAGTWIIVAEGKPAVSAAGVSFGVSTQLRYNISPTSMTFANASAYAEYNNFVFQSAGTVLPYVTMTTMVNNLTAATYYFTLSPTYGNGALITGGTNITVGTNLKMKAIRIA